MKKGKVYLVGAGPGDPGLLTLRGKEVLSQAEVVLYDALVHPDLLKFVPAQARLVFRGSRGKKGSWSQVKINQKLVQWAREGKVVVRLKGGDPFVFGRGAEELLPLADKRIPFEVVPGVSSSYAVPAYAGIPLTHRDMNSSFTVVTGHEDPTKAESQIDWGHLASDQGTLVFLMGLHNLPGVCHNLIASGKDPHTPAAIIQKGTTASQKVVQGTLATLPDLAKKAALKAPAAVVVGKVVSLRSRLDWWKKKPLSGLRVLVTRNQVKSGYLAGLLREKGAEVFEVATIELVPVPLKAKTREILRGAGRYDWIVFSSANAVEFFQKAFSELGLSLGDLRSSDIACVGPATAKAVRSAGLEPTLVPQDFKQEGLVAAFREKNLKGRKVLFVRAQEGRDLLMRYFQQAKVPCDLLALYRNHLPAGTPGQLRDLFRHRGGVDLLTFASSSAVDHFYAAFTAKERRKFLAGIPTAVIGPVTGASVKKWGGRVAVRPRAYTLPALVEAIGHWAAKRSR